MYLELAKNLGTCVDSPFTIKLNPHKIAPRLKNMKIFEHVHLNSDAHQLKVLCNFFWALRELQGDLEFSNGIFSNYIGINAGLRFLETTGFLYTCYAANNFSIKMFKSLMMPDFTALPTKLKPCVASELVILEFLRRGLIPQPKSEYKF